MNQLSKQEARNILDYELADTLDLMKKINRGKTNKNITFSRNIFLPLTPICQNNCGYCTFKQSPQEADFLVMDKKTVNLLIKRAVEHKCTEALFTFGESADTNELIQAKLAEYNYDSMVDYVCELSVYVLRNYDILPHTNMGIISRDDLHKLSAVNASMGLMLETTNKKLLKTIVHNESPGKNPKKRIEFIENAGREKIPFTTGLLVGIGETLDDRIDSLFKIRQLHDKYGHIQEIILQNFKPKKGIPMENHPEPPLYDLVKLTLVARLLFPDVSIQIPPNLNQKLISLFAVAGADDVGGISPITHDYINPENGWPKINELEYEINSVGYHLTERLPVYKKYINREYLKGQVYEKAVKLQKNMEN